MSFFILLENTSEYWNHGPSHDSAASALILQKTSVLCSFSVHLGLFPTLKKKVHYIKELFKNRIR